jgi:hypothetical protein
MMSYRGEIVRVMKVQIHIALGTVELYRLQDLGTLDINDPEAVRGIAEPPS